MRDFHYAAIREQKWDSEILGLIAAIYKEAGKQEMYLKQRPEELEKLVEIAKVQSTEASNAIDGSSPQAHVSASWLKKKLRPETAMSRKLPDTVMR